MKSEMKECKNLKYVHVYNRRCLKYLSGESGEKYAHFKPENYSVFII